MIASSDAVEFHPADVREHRHPLIRGNQRTKPINGGAFLERRMQDVGPVALPLAGFE